MTNVIPFIRKSVEDGTQSDVLISRVNELLADFPMEGIILALFQSSVEQDETALLLPAIIPIIQKYDLTTLESEL
jgi:hypothetical protein